MIGKLRVLNSLTREKEVFEPINAPYVGMYVCGPTVYNDVHLGNVRTFISFDVISRYLRFLGYQVRYVRNITDVGHLTDDADDGEDKISKRAKLENLEPMEIVQKYTVGFRDVMATFNAQPPDIEPTATGHIVEQIEMIKQIMDNGFAYEVNGSIYFDVEKFHKSHHYGTLSGRKIEELMENTRDLDGQQDKRSGLDFALWKKATKGHIMRWPSPWGDGFPGWHLECSVMSTKYLGDFFDIHGGGMDLKFPHHECEMAQCKGSNGSSQAKYWLHTNMLTMNGTKMSKSLGNSFLPHELISGDHPLLERGYSPMTIRFFMMQSHYASTLDFSNEALGAAQKGWMKLNNGLRTITELSFPEGIEEAIDEKQMEQINRLADNCYHAMNDDFNTALTIGHLFNMLKKINSLKTGQLKYEQVGKEAFDLLKRTFLEFTTLVLGLKQEGNIDHERLLQVIIEEYAFAKRARNYDKVDELRSKLREEGIVVKDMKDAIDWAYEE
ncbi:MAG: cysteine--tRNA ligase [Bacteroidota bacterium]